MNGALDNSTTSVVVASGTDLGAVFTNPGAPYNRDTISVGDELMRVDAVSSNTLTVTRGVYGTTATAHLNGSVVRLRNGNSTATDDTSVITNPLANAGATTFSATDTTIITAAQAQSLSNSSKTADIFPASGYVKIGDEIIEYASITENTLNGLNSVSTVFAAFISE